MSSQYSQTHEDAENTENADASFLKTQFQTGRVAYAVAALSLLRVLRSGRSRPTRTVIYTITASLFVALGTIQRRQHREGTSGNGDHGSSIEIDHPERVDDEAATTTESLDKTAAEQGSSDVRTEELSDPEPPEEETDADVSPTKVADEPAEAVGPSSEDAVPEQTEGTEPEPTPGKDANSADPAELREEEMTENDDGADTDEGDEDEATEERDDQDADEFDAS